VPVLPKQLTVFEELVDAVPGVAEMETTYAAGYVNVHWRDAGSLPVGDATASKSRSGQLRLVQKGEQWPGPMHLGLAIVTTPP